MLRVTGQANTGCTLNGGEMNSACVNSKTGEEVVALNADNARLQQAVSAGNQILLAVENLNTQEESVKYLQLSQGGGGHHSRQQLFVTPKNPDDVKMGQLRSGKSYSPARPSNTRERRRSSVSPYSRDTGEKRRLNTSSSSLNSIGSDAVVPPPTKVIVQRQRTNSANSTGQGGELRVAMKSGTNAADLIEAQTDPNLRAFMASMHLMMKTTLDEIKTDAGNMKDSATKCLEGLETLKTAVAEQKKTVSQLEKDVAIHKKALIDHRQSVSTKFAEIDEKLIKCDAAISSHKSEIDNSSKLLQERIDALEKISTDLSDKVANLEAGKSSGPSASANGSMNLNTDSDGFLIDRSIMMHRMVVKRGKTEEDMVKMLLYDTLTLKEIELTKVLKVGKERNGKCSIKVELKDPEQQKMVMTTKHRLNTATQKVIKSVFISRAKSEQQRIHDHNYAIMMKKLKIDDRYKQNSAGRIVPKTQRINEPVNSGPSRGKGRGKKSGPSNNENQQVELSVGQRSETGLHVSQEVLDAMTLSPSGPSGGPSPGPPVPSGMEYETTPAPQRNDEEE